MINRAYDKIIILCYPGGAGGNFLINCLSLNEQCVLRDAQLAEQQLSNGIRIQEKLDYFQDQLSKSFHTRQWRDLNLGCSNLFGIDNKLYLFEYPEVIERKFNYVIKQLINQEKYLFLVAHTTQYLTAYLKFWTQARVIFFTDYHDFIRKRGYDTKVEINSLTNYWSNVKGEHWPNLPPLNFDEFLQLPDFVRYELLIDFNGEIFKWIEVSPTVEELHDRAVACYLQKLGDRSYKWNVRDNYSGDEQKFLNNLNKCAQWTGITVEATTTGVVEYYRNWLNTISKVNPLSGPE